LKQIFLVLHNAKNNLHKRASDPGAYRGGQNQYGCVGLK